MNLRFKRVFFCAVLLLTLPLFGAAAANCKVKTAEGDVFDFGALANTESSTSVHSSGGNFVMHSIFCGVAQATSQCIEDNAAFCFSEVGQDYISLARWQSASDIKSATTTANGVTLQFENISDAAFKTIYFTIEMTCADKASDPVGEHPPGINPYRVFYRQDHPAACKGAANGSGGLSGGSIFLIIFFVSAFVYVAVGCALNWKLRGLALGKEACPQSAFWAAIASNSVAGVRFTAGGFKKKNSYETSSDPAHEAL